MDLIKNKFLFIPLVLFSLVFGLDKIFFLESVREYTQHWQKIEQPFYHSRKDLFHQLKEEYPSRVQADEKLGVIFGTSRAGEFDFKEIAKNRPGTYTYNFSAPLACPAYHYYWMDKIDNAKMKIDFAVVEVDPVLFHPLSVKYSLAYSYDYKFMLDNVDLGRERPRDPGNIRQVWKLPGTGFSFDEAETYFLKSFFALYKYPPDPKNISRNQDVNLFLGKSGIEFRRGMLEGIQKANKLNLGGIPNPLVTQESDEVIAKKAVVDARTHLLNYRPAHTQVIFFKKLLRKLAAQGSEVVLYWPLAPRPYRNIMEREGLVKTLQGLIHEEIALIKKDYPKASIKLMDLDKSRTMDCRFFVDSHHLSGKCYNKLTKHLLAER